MGWIFHARKIKNQRNFSESVFLMGLHQQRLLELHGSQFAVFHMCLILVIKWLYHHHKKIYLNAPCVPYFSLPYLQCWGQGTWLQHQHCFIWT